MELQVKIPGFFDGVPDDELERALKGLELRRFPAGSIVIAEGDQPNELYITQSGRAEVLVSDSKGEPHAVGRIRPGSTLGEMSLFTGQPAVGTVRATSDLEVLVMSGLDFERFAETYPRIYRNLGAILSERLARTNRLAVKEGAGWLTILNDWGAPPLVSYALAASIAWHTRAPALLLVVSTDPPPELAALESPLAAGANGGPRAHVSVVPSLERLRAESLVTRIDDLFQHYQHVLVHVRGRPAELELKTARTVDLAAPGDEVPADASGPRHTVRAWSNGTGLRGPARDGVTHLPGLGPEDERTLAQGLLPTGTPAGTALGWLARDLARLKVGVALGAGSMRGYAHIGVLNVLLRSGVPIDYICGTSVGSAVAGMYAMGLDPDACVESLDGAGAAMFRPTVPLKSFLSTRALGRFIEGLGTGRRIEDLPVPLALVAADLITQREVVFRRGELWLGVVASCAIPGIFPPQPVGPFMLVDGGVLNPVPASVASEMGADVVIAVRLGSMASPPETEVAATPTPGRRPSVVSVTLKAIEIMQSRIATDAGDGTTITIVPEVSELVGAKLRNFSAGRKYIHDGVVAAEQALPRIAAALPWVRSG